MLSGLRSVALLACRYAVYGHCREEDARVGRVIVGEGLTQRGGVQREVAPRKRRPQGGVYTQ